MRSITLSFIVTLFAFGQDSTFLRGYENRTRMNHEQELQRQRLEAEAALQKERLAFEREKLDKLRQQPASSPTASGESKIEATPDEVRKVIADLLRRHPDLRDYRDEMARLSNMLKIGEGLTMAEYLDSLYVVARHGLISRMVKPTTSAAPLTNDDVITLVGSGLQESTIISKIQSSPRAYQVGVADLLRLKSANVPDAVIRAMLETK